MIPYLLFIPFLVRAWALPAPDVALSIFDDKSIPIVDDPTLKVFNLTAFARDVGIETRALSLQYTLYDVVFDGRNQGNFQNFQVKGDLMVVRRIPSPGTKNGANQVDVVISIGDPAGNPVAGSIQYVTNRYLNPLLGGKKDTSRLDFVRETNSATSARFVVDTSLAAANQISVFNAKSGLFADVYNPASGAFRFVVENSQMSGNINFAGRGVISGAKAPYKAKISGKAKQRGKMSL